MEQKKFVLNLSLQIHARDAKEASEILCQEETLAMIVEAILQSKDNIREIDEEIKVELLN